MRLKTTFLMILASVVALTAAISIPAVENKGEDQITIYGGSRGNVPFPHHRHQEALTDCNICHATFPQKKGAIEEMKKSGEIKPSPS